MAGSGWLEQMSEGWGKGSTRRWRVVRAQVLKRDQYRCQLKLDVCTTIAECVHHLRGKRHGDDPEWLVAACNACNLKIGDPERVTKDPPMRPRMKW